MQADKDEYRIHHILIYVVHSVCVHRYTYGTIHKVIYCIRLELHFAQSFILIQVCSYLLKLKTKHSARQKHLTLMHTYRMCIVSESITRSMGRANRRHLAHSIEEHSDSAGSQHGDPDHPKNSTNCSFHNCRAILKISSNFTPDLLSNSWISDCTVSMVIYITSTIWLLVSFATPDVSTKFYCSSFITLWVNRQKQANQTNQR